MNKAQLEIACFNVNSAIIAQENGADRVEFCAEIAEGGTTPDIELIVEMSKELSIDIYVMVRSRGGDFVYSDQEFAEMKNTIHTFKKI